MIGENPTSPQSTRQRIALAMHSFRTGQPARAQVVLGEIVRAEPGNFEALHYLGLSHAMTGEFEKAEAWLRQAIAIKPDYVEALATLGKVCRDLGKLDQAAGCFEQATRIEPRHGEAHYGLGLVLQELNRPDEALSRYDRVIELQPDFAPAHAGRGDVMGKLGKPLDALASYDRALKLNPEFAEVHGNRGDVLQELERLDEALASYDAAIALRPDLAHEHANRGCTLEKLYRYEEALGSFERAIALQPDNAKLRHFRGRALYELGRTDEALSDYAAALRLAPDFAQARSAVFAHHLGELKDLATIERLGTDAAESNIRQKYAVEAARYTIYGFRVIHDLEQINYLIARGHADVWLRPAQRRLEDIHRRYLAGQGDSAGLILIRLSDDEANEVNAFREALLRYTPARPVEHFLNPKNDWRAIEEQYLGRSPEVTYIDDFLLPGALQELRNFCLLSTVWKLDYRNQYLGAFANTGFFGPLHFGIARELRLRLPRIYGTHRLEQLWAFKYDPRVTKGINAHADFARVNLNFWITPDEANLDPESGGLIVYDVPCPPSWGFREYNLKEEAIHEFLRNNRSGSRRIPYRCNRAVLFNSTLFHETDEIRFRDGYENRRINITYLFGKGLRMS